MRTFCIMGQQVTWLARFIVEKTYLARLVDPKQRDLAMTSLIEHRDACCKRFLGVVARREMRT